METGMSSSHSKMTSQARRWWLLLPVVLILSIAGAALWMLHARHTPPAPIVPSQSYSEALEIAHDGKPGAARVLYQQLGRSDLSDIRRAGLLAELANYPSPQALKLAKADLTSDTQVTRQAAVDAVVGLAPRERRAQLLGPLLDSSESSIRFLAVRGLLDLSPDELGLFFEPLRDAVREYQADLASQPPTGQSLLQLAALYHHDAEWQRALDSAREAQRLEPRNLEAILAQLVPLERLGQGDTAQRLLGELLERHPESSLLQHTLGQWLLGHEQQEYALLALARAVELEPDNAPYRYDLAVALHDLGQQEPAQRQLQDLLQRWPAYRRGRVLLINYWKESGQLQNVQVLLAELEQQNPDDPALQAP